MLVKLTSVKLMDAGEPLGSASITSLIENQFQQTYCIASLEVGVSSSTVSLVDPAVLMAVTVML